MANEMRLFFPFLLYSSNILVESSVDFGLLEAENRRIIDPIAKRYFFVKEPVKLVVENAPVKTKEISSFSEIFSCGYVAPKPTHVRAKYGFDRI